MELLQFPEEKQQTLKIIIIIRMLYDEYPTNNNNPLKKI